MDRFSEQLIAKLPDKGDIIKRILIIAGELAVTALLVLLTLWSGFTITLFSFVAFAGSVWLLKYLLEGTSVEYEYIVTNDDLDIDKIIGKRKRKRMITISLKTVADLAPYLDDTEVSADVTVVAHDNTGEDLWYLLADTEKFGRLMLLFNADQRTRDNIIGGTEGKVRAKFIAAKRSEEQ